MDDAMTCSFRPAVKWDPEVWAYLLLAFGEEHMQRIAECLARPPLSLCFRVNLLQVSLEAARSELSEALQSRGMAEPQISTPSQLSNVLTVTGSGPHDVNPISSIDQSIMKEAVVDRKCGEAVLRGAPVYVPGVLGTSPNVQAGDKVAVFIASGPMTRGTVLGSEHDTGSRADRASMFIGMGTMVVGRAEVFKGSAGLAIAMDRPVYSIPAATGLLEGKAMLQNLPSAVAASVLAPTPGSRVLDMCAAPGGKTTAIAELMQDRGEVIALDRSHSKVGNIVDLKDELGLTCIKAYKMDSSKALLGSTAGAKEKQTAVSAKSVARQQRREAAMRARGIKPVKPRDFTPPTAGWEANSFDYVMLDAPCTGLGLRPRLIQPLTLKEVQGTASYQRKLIDTAVELVKPGGTLVFSTCSISPAENEANVRYTLDKFTCLRLVAAEPRIGGPGLVTKPGTQKDREVWLSEEESKKVQRFDPAAADTDTIGFFIAKYEKITV